MGGKDYVIKSLLDLKKAIQENSKETAIIMRFYLSQWIQIEGRVVLAKSGTTHAPLLDGVTSVFVLPLREVLTPADFSIHKFKKQFKFGVDQAATRDWREFMKNAKAKKAACESSLAPKPAA